MNILIIGFGTAGKFYLKILKKLKKVNIYIHDPHIKNFNYKNKIHKISSRDLKKLNITHGIIATPSNLHYKYASLLLQNSINILIEKPFVLKLSHAQKLINLSISKNVKSWVVFQNRFNVAVKQMKKLIKINKIGNIFLVDCALIWKRDKKYYSSGWKGKYKSDGGVLTNQAIHLLDTLIYLFGDIKKFSSIAYFNKKKLQAEDLLVMSLVHKSNLISSFKATTRANANYSAVMDIIGEKGRLAIKGISLNEFFSSTGGSLKKNLKYSENFSDEPGAIGAMGNGHYQIIREFISKTIKKSSKNLEIKKNYHVLKVIHSVYNNSKVGLLKNIKDKQSKLGI